MDKMLIIGCGNMGGAMLEGWLSAGSDLARFAVLDPALETAPGAVRVFRSPDEAEAAGTHDAVLLGFKPQQLKALAPGLQSLATERVMVFSVLGGIRLAQLRAHFPDARAHVRVMPNLAVRIRKSPVILAEQGLDAAERQSVFELFDALGTATWLESEETFDLVTALAGSGPGFVYRFIDALAAAATRLGVDRADAAALALAMVEGASVLAASSSTSPAELADRVASPGGMTREGLNVLDRDDVLVKLLVECLQATAERGAEMSREMS